MYYTIKLSQRDVITLCCNRFDKEIKWTLESFFFDADKVLPSIWQLLKNLNWDLARVDQLSYNFIISEEHSSMNIFFGHSVKIDEGIVATIKNQNNNKSIWEEPCYFMLALFMAIHYCLY